MSPSSPRRRSSVRRFRVGALSVIQIVFVLLIFFAVNYLSSQHHRPFDLSDDLTFTLSPSTSRYLASEVITQREEPVRLIVAFRADSPFYARIRPVAEEYERLSGGKIRTTILDPIRSNDRAEAIASEYDLTFNQDLVIIDARTAAQREAEVGRTGSANVRIVRMEDMLVYETDANNQRRVRGFLGEDALRSGLVGAIEGKPRTLWLLADKSDLTGQGKEGYWDVLGANLVSQNILPERIAIAGVSRIPDEVSVLALVDPIYDLTPEELRVLEEYWSRPRASILVTAGKNPVPPRLRAFLRRHGVTPQNDRVITVEDGQVRPTVLARFTSGLEFTRDLWEKTTLLEGYSRSLDVRENAEDLLLQSIAPYVMLEADPAFWGETTEITGAPEFDAREDNPPPLALAAAVIRGNPNDDRFAADIGRLVVLGNTDFLSPDNARQANLDLLASAANWLVGREELAGQGPKNLRLYKLPLLDPQVSFINRVNLLFLPGLLLIIGGIVWSSRRS